MLRLIATGDFMNEKEKEKKIKVVLKKTKLSELFIGFKNGIAGLFFKKKF